MKAYYIIERLEYALSSTIVIIPGMVDPRQPIIQDVNIFTILHLITTLFLVDKKKDKMGGFCYKALRKVGHEHLLDNICILINSKIGNTTFGDYIRHKRNKLTVHGMLEFSSLPEENKAVTFNNDLTDDFTELMEQFEQELLQLEENLCTLLGYNYNGIVHFIEKKIGIY
ncbi:hypothetical protein KAU45_03450 [bacterium]|nr:hypothetical protein [bacterium]